MDEPADSDQRLVAAVRRGDDRAFEVLYERYQRRIHAYVVGMVKDHGRAEDVTQEIFVSALRRMRQTEQPLAFKPWLYQIAKNSCIDAFRRSKRTEEVSYDADDALAPADHSRLVGSGPSPEAAVAAKQDIESLCGAFGGLSETHHEILVLRELEGLSYHEIGDRMGMSRPAVESTLFRARRRLTEEYDDIVSGARCQRIHGIIATAAESRLGTRDTRRLARHLSHCQGCRREALAAGLDRGLFTRPSVRERIAKVAGFLPLPGFLRFRRGEVEAALPSSGRGGWSSQLPLLSDHLSGGWSKAAAGAALLVAGAGTGAGVHQVTGASDKPVPAISEPATSAANPTPGAGSAVPTPTAGARDGAAVPASERASKRSGKRRASTLGGSESPAAAAPATPAGGGAVTPSTPGGSNPQTSSAPKEQDSAPAREKSKAPSKPDVKLPVTTTDPVQGVRDAVQETAGTVQQATDPTSQALDETVQQTAGPGPVTDAAEGVTGAAGKTAGALGEAVNTVVEDAAGAVDTITAGAGG